MMNIEIKSCNNLVNARIDIAEGELTVLYGPNGSGKSSIASAIAAHCGLIPSKLEDLRPYGSATTPTVMGVERGLKTLVFNEDYVKNTLFQDDNHLIDNGFRFFVESAGYREAMKKTRVLLRNAHSAFKDEAELSELIENIDALVRCYGNSKDDYAKNSAIAKSAVGVGNVIDHIPEEVFHFAPLIQGPEAAKWVSWHANGKAYSELGICPYCGKEFGDGSLAACRKVDEIYSSKVIDHTTTVAGAFEKMHACLSDDANEKVKKILASVNGATLEARQFLGTIKNEAVVLRNKLIALSMLDFSSLRNLDDISAMISSLRIDMSLLSTMSSPYVCEHVNHLNAIVDDLLASMNELKAAVGVQNRALTKAIGDSTNDMNAFFDNAGFPYRLSVESTDGVTCAIRLMPRRVETYVDKPKERLSYGERNALAIALFSVQAACDAPQLIVLDDPISSFDSTKKYAIIQRLFAQGNGVCNGITTLLLTHDPEVVMMMEKVHRRRLCPLTTFRVLNEEGILSAVPVSGDITSTITALKSKAAADMCLASRLARTRCAVELLNGESLGWSLLSSLIHRKAVPDIKESSGGCRPFEESELELAVEEVRKMGFGAFDYRFLLSQLDDESLLDQYFSGQLDSYQRLAVFRILSTGPDGKRSEMKRAIDAAGVHETVSEYANVFFHVENLTAYQFVDARLDVVPQYVVEHCDKVMVLFANIVGYHRGCNDLIGLAQDKRQWLRWIDAGTG